jgi:hypothetical protein
MNSYGVFDSNYNTNIILSLPLSMPYLKKEKKNETPLNRLHVTTHDIDSLVVTLIMAIVNCIDKLVSFVVAPFLFI